MKNEKEEIMEMLNDMNDEQIHKILVYVTDEYDEENHEEKNLKIISRLHDEILEKQKILVLQELQIALSKRRDFSVNMYKAVEEECERIISENR